MPLFRYDASIVDRFPTVVGGVIHATGVTNGPTPSKLADALAEECATVLARIGDTPLSEVPSLAAWRRVFRGFGVDPTQYRSAAEALLRRLTKQGSLPSINALVDLANLVSVRYALPVAVFDQRERDRDDNGAVRPGRRAVDRPRVQHHGASGRGRGDLRGRRRRRPGPTLVLAAERGERGGRRHDGDPRHRRGTSRRSASRHRPGRCRPPAPPRRVRGGGGDDVVHRRRRSSIDDRRQ